MWAICGILGCPVPLYLIEYMTFLANKILLIQVGSYDIVVSSISSKEWQKTDVQNVSARTRLIPIQPLEIG